MQKGFRSGFKYYGNVRRISGEKNDINSEDFHNPPPSTSRCCIRADRKLQQSNNEVEKEHVHWFCPPTLNGTHNVHDSQDVVYHSFASVVLHHLRVSYHQRFHPLLPADGALVDPPPVLSPFPTFPLPLPALWAPGQTCSQRDN